MENSCSVGIQRIGFLLSTDFTVMQLPMKLHNKSQRRKAILDLKRKFRCGDPTAAGNIAATYREIGNRRRAFHWWQKAASLQDGDAWLEVGYCLQYGIGTKMNVRAAVRSYRNALAAYYITEYAKEEAQYHLAIALIDSGNHRSRREVRLLLQQAAEDSDFLQATDC